MTAGAMTAAELFPHIRSAPSRWTASRRCHLGLVIVHRVYRAWWIWILFYTPA